MTGGARNTCTRPSGRVLLRDDVWGSGREALRDLLLSIAAYVVLAAIAAYLVLAAGASI